MTNQLLGVRMVFACACMWIHRCLGNTFCDGAHVHSFVQHDRKEEMKQKADQAEGNIEFRVDAEMEDTGMEDLETTTSKLLGERDELIEVNKKLAEEVGESPMECAMTEDQDVLIEQIKGLKGENDRLRDLQSQTAKRNPKKSKKKREGFGEQQA